MRLLGKALTFDDVLLVPAFSQVLPKDTSLATQFSRNIRLNLPLVSAAMDTVTEARLAIAIAQEGGIGIVHKNLTAAKSRPPRWPKSSATNPACCAIRWSSRPTHHGPSGHGAVRATSACRASRSVMAARWSVSSPAAICVLKPATTCPSAKS